MRVLKYCLDTHPLIWYFTGQKTLSPKIKSILDDVFLKAVPCLIPTIVLLESFHLSLKHDKFYFPAFLKELRIPNLTIVPLDKIVLSYCYRLPKNLNIHDRVVAATTMATKSTLITKDQLLRNTLGLKTTW